MSETLSLTGDMTDDMFKDSLASTIGYASVLQDSSNFTARRDQEFAQAVAASQFEGMETDIEKEIDLLKQIELNTREDSLTYISATPFASGGIVTSPTVGLIGEAGYSEAVIPLKNPDDPLNQNGVIMMLKKIEERLEAAERMAVKQTATQIKTLDTQRAILGEAIGA
jgi:hypothetical protein